MSDVLGLRAAAAELVLYRVVHPTDPVADFWTADYVIAVSTFERFIRMYGRAHLHVEMHHAGQYDAECLMRMGDEA